jgi:hypothetical protein
VFCCVREHFGIESLDLLSIRLPRKETDSATPEPGKSEVGVIIGAVVGGVAIIGAVILAVVIAGERALILRSGKD